MSTLLEPIQLDEHLSIKKLDSENEKDVWLAKELDRDELIGGENGYLWPIHIAFNDTRYLFRDDIYGSPYAIYDGLRPVGYIELTDILVMNKVPFVDIAYSILESERCRGYATKTLFEVTKMILRDSKIQKTTLTIANTNLPSQKVAQKAGYIRDTSMDILDTIGYQKTKSIF